jgi:hypothetical protein
MGLLMTRESRSHGCRVEAAILLSLNKRRFTNTLAQQDSVAKKFRSRCHGDLKVNANVGVPW